MKAVWKYIDAHHEEWGTALFILPFSLGVYLLYVVCGLIAWAVQ